METNESEYPSPRKGKLVYIASPDESLPTSQEMRTIIEATESVARTGHSPVVPYFMTLQWEVMFDKKVDDILSIKFDVLSRCDCLVYVEGSKKSAEQEITFAEDQGIPVSSVHEFSMEQR